MSPAAAAKLLDLPADATPEQLEARFHELRTKLEEKIGKAPTPGLKAKYRESLEEITTAFETLTLAADSSALPVAQRTGSTVAGVVDPGVARAHTQSPGSATPATAPRRKSGGKEFILVAAIAVIVLAGGGWFVLKTRAENAEKARVAAEQKAEADRLAGEKLKAEETKKARQEDLLVRVRTDLAAARIAWEVAEREERNAERRLSDLKSDLRGLRDATPGQLAEAQAIVAAQQAYYTWLSDTLARHPAKIARSKAEELLSARQAEAAEAAVAELKTSLAELEQQIPAQRAALLDLEGELRLATDADVTWKLQDAFGRTRAGQGPADLDGLAIGPGRLQLQKPRWPAREEKFTIRRDQPVKLDAGYVTHSLRLESSPAGAEVRQADGTRLGVTPLPLTDLPPGPLVVTLRKVGYYDQPVSVTLPQSGTDVVAVNLRVKPKGLVKPERWSGPAKVRVEYRMDVQSFGAHASRNNSHIVEEWDFSDADPRVGWRQALRRFVSLAGTNRQYMPADGSVVRLRLQPDRTWSGEFIQGGMKDPAHNPIWANAVNSFWMVTFGLSDLFPAAEVEIGGSWSLRPENFFSTLGMKNYSGQVKGRLLAIERDASGERADIEYAYSYTVSGISGQAVLKLQVNLEEGYVLRMEGSDSSSGDNKFSSSYTVTVTKR